MNFGKNSIRDHDGEVVISGDTMCLNKQNRHDFVRHLLDMYL